MRTNTRLILNSREFNISIIDGKTNVSCLISKDECLLIRDGNYSVQELFERLNQYSELDNQEIYAKSHTVIRG